MVRYNASLIMQFLLKYTIEKMAQMMNVPREHMQVTPLRSGNLNVC